MKLSYVLLGAGFAIIAVIIIALSFGPPGLCTTDATTHQVFCPAASFNIFEFLFAIPLLLAGMTIGVFGFRTSTDKQTKDVARICQFLYILSRDSRPLPSG